MRLSSSSKSSMCPLEDSGATVFCLGTLPVGCVPLSWFCDVDRRSMTDSSFETRIEIVAFRRLPLSSTFVEDRRYP